MAAILRMIGTSFNQYLNFETNFYQKVVKDKTALFQEMG